jgi:Arc/MetJ-type ribon-helix-helix transcriptional regulator
MQKNTSVSLGEHFEGFIAGEQSGASADFDVEEFLTEIKKSHS